VLVDPQHAYTQRLIAAMPKMPQKLASSKAASL
jgi:ABC-type oligopeptide transport system ATPase subunit